MLPTEDMLRKLEMGEPLTTDELIYVKGSLQDAAHTLFKLGAYGAPLAFWCSQKLSIVNSYLRARGIKSP